jgi:hypothetical protein
MATSGSKTAFTIGPGGGDVPRAVYEDELLTDYKHVVSTCPAKACPLRTDSCNSTPAAVSSAQTGCITGTVCPTTRSVTVVATLRRRQRQHGTRKAHPRPFHCVNSRQLHTQLTTKPSHSSQYVLCAIHCSNLSDALISHAVDSNPR